MDYCYNTIGKDGRRIVYGNCEICFEAGEYGTECRNCKVQHYTRIVVDQEGKTAPELHRVPGARWVWKPACSTGETLNVKYKIALTSYYRFIHPIALAEANQQSSYITVKMIAKREHDIKSTDMEVFIVDRTKINEMVESTNGKARKNFRERLEKAMYKLLETEIAVLDLRLIDELKWRPHLRTHYDERFTRHGQDMGNCTNCGREGIAGNSCACTDEPGQTIFILWDGFTEYINPHCFSKAITGLKSPELATYKEHEESDVYKYKTITMIPRNMREFYKLSKIDLLSAIDIYEEAVSRYERVRDRYPNNHVWVDKMRYWIKVSRNHYDEKTQDEHVKWSTFHGQPWTSEQEENNQMEEVE